MAIYSLQVEKYVLSGLIRHPTSFADVESFISDNDFIKTVGIIDYQSVIFESGGFSGAADAFISIRH